MDVLGIGAWTIPGAACLVRDGRIVAAAREDRFTRRPDDPGFPRQAIEYCLRAGKLGPSGLTRIVVSGQPLYREPDGRARSLLRRLVGRGAPEGSPGERLARELAPDVPVETEEVAVAHARAALRMAGFDEAAVLVLDGARAAVARGGGADVEILARDVDADPAALLARARELTGCGSVAVGGAGAGSGDVVRRMAAAGGFDRIWFQPAGAAAAAVGAALGASGSGTATGPAGRALGPAYNAHQIRTFLRSRDVEPRELPRDDVAGAVAPLLEESRSVGWFAGRIEFGETAPASRAILSVRGAVPGGGAEGAPDPPAGGTTDPAAAPVLAVPAARAAELFDLDERILSPLVPAGNTPDGPTVFRTDREEHRALHAVLEAMEAAGRDPVLECRPLAAPGEPPACTPRDAFEAAERRDLDVLVMERYAVRPRP